MRPAAQLSFLLACLACASGQRPTAPPAEDKAPPPPDASSCDDHIVGVLLGAPCDDDASCVFVALEGGRRGAPVYAWSEDAGRVLVGEGRGGDVLSTGRCEGRVWVTVDGPRELVRMSEVLPDTMGHLRAGVHTWLYDDPSSPDDGEPGMEIVANQRVHIDVLGVDQVDGRWWVEVAVLERSTCEGPTKQGRTGWLPLHGDDGRLQVWFSTDC